MYTSSTQASLPYLGRKNSCMPRTVALRVVRSFLQARQPYRFEGIDRKAHRHHNFFQNSSGLGIHFLPVLDCSLSLQHAWTSSNRQQQAIGRPSISTVQTDGSLDALAYTDGILSGLQPMFLSSLPLHTAMGPSSGVTSQNQKSAKRTSNMCGA